MGCSVQAVLPTGKPFTGHHDSQIHARNPKGPAERDLTCQARAEGFYQCSSKRRVGGNRSRAQKWYLGDQNLGVKTESQSLTVVDRGIELQRLKLSPPAQVHRLCQPGSDRNWRPSSKDSVAKSINKSSQRLSRSVMTRIES